MITLKRKTGIKPSFSESQRFVDNRHWARHGLIVHYLMNEGGGNSVYDSSVNMYTGTLTNGALWDTDNNKTSVVLDGTNDYISVANISFSSGPFSTSIWFNTTSATDQRLVSKSSAANNQIWSMITLSGNINCGVYDGIDWNECEETSQSWADGKWHLLTTVISATTITCYIDSKVGTSTGHDNSFPTNSEVWVLGMQQAGTTNEPFNGKLGSFRMYNRVLSQAEHFNLFYDPYPEWTDILWAGSAPAGGATIPIFHHHYQLARSA